MLLLGIALTLPYVQTKIGQYATESLNTKYGTNIYIDQVEITVFGAVKLKKILIKDEKKDTLISAKTIFTNILDLKNIASKKLYFGGLRANQLQLKIKTYKGDTISNFNKFVAAFETGKKSKEPFVLTSTKLTVTNSFFSKYDYNLKNPKQVEFSKINILAQKFKIIGPDIYAKIEELSLNDYRGLVVKNLKSNFSLTEKSLKLEGLDLKTENSKIKGFVNLLLGKKRFNDFSNSVIFDANFEESFIASNDIRYFSDVIGKNQSFNLKAKIKGSLNNLSLKKLHLIDNNKTEIIGDVVFKNLFQKPEVGHFYMKGSFKKVASSYTNLTTLLPSVLGEKLPTSLKKLGNFNLIGDAEVTTKMVNADFKLNTILGDIKSKLLITNMDNIDNASYVGNVDLNNFDLGTFLNRNDIGKVTLNLDVDGKGFSEKYLDTKISGDVKSIRYNNYTYQNIIADGSFKKPIFKGKLSINDPNLFLNFDGLINLNKQNSTYDFKAKVDYANLKNLNFNSDQTSIFRGDIVMKATGNSVSNAKGEIVFTNASYQNNKDTYNFDDLKINSFFTQNNERVITFDSPNNIKGEIQGKFEFNQIQTMVQNSLGSLYTNFKLDKLKKGQFLKFNFSDFNKVIEILNPKIKLSENAFLQGSINGDSNDFKVNFESKTVDAFNNHLDNVKVEIDNKNPLYNAYIQIDSIKNKNYKIRDFSLINITHKDTLSFRTEFKGGDVGQDIYNLNLYHTIDKNNQNIVGFNKSEVTFKDFIWNINVNGDDKNKIVFDKKFNNFSFDDILISHENQFVSLKGNINGLKNKNLQLTFNEVDLSKITPAVEKFKFDGKVNGDVFIKQENDVYQPTAALDIKELQVNDNKLGNLILNIEGDENFRKFKINSQIENENFKSFTANGELSVANDETFVDLNLSFQKFNLGILSSLGGEVISNIRGFASGNVRIDGNVKDIDYNGRLFLDDAGLKIPYLNVDYLIKQNSIIDITKTKFIFQETKLIDSRYKTEANLEGYIKHKQFSNWELNLDINSDRFLALDTKDKEDAAYYGKAFINGKASINGPTNALVIDVNAKSGKDTYIKIPINQGESVSDNKYIHFLTVKEKYGKNNNNNDETTTYKGLQLNFDLDITQDATIEVILNRDSGHGMKGKGVGNLAMNINTLGKFEMYGDYQIYEGDYNFKYGGLIDKKLKVKKYGSIVWDGDPLKAVLNLEAVYQTNANPAVLIDNPSVNKKIPVEVIIGVRGNLSNPEPDFNINFPNVSSVLKSEIETKLNDKDIRQTQALYLLSTGSFLSPEGLSQAQVTNSLYEKAGAIFGDLLNSKDSKTSIGIDIVQGERSALNPTAGRVGLNFTSQISDRISFNGKVGVPTGGATETAIIGNFEAQYRVNEDGTLNLRLFNRENDINYIGQGVGYTQGIGISYEVDFDTFNELISKIFKKKIGEEKPKVNLNNQDSDLFPGYINVVKDKSQKNDKPKTDENPKPNTEAPPKKEDY